MGKNDIEAGKPEGVPDNPAPGASLPEPSLAKAVDDVIGGKLDTPSEGPRKPHGPKKLEWTDAFEVDPENPLVDVEMNLEKWTETLSDDDTSFKMLEQDHFTVSAGEDFMELRPIIHYQPKEYLMFSLHFNLTSYFLRPDRSPWTSESLKDFQREFKSCLDKQFYQQNLQQVIAKKYDHNSSPEFKMNIQDLSPQQIQELLKKMKKAIALALEIFSRMLKSEGKLNYKIINPRKPPDKKALLSAIFGMPEDSAKKEQEKVAALEFTNIKLKLDDMGGNPELKEQIQMLVLQYQNPKFFRERGVTLPKGILLHGPPGTGKNACSQDTCG